MSEPSGPEAQDDLAALAAGGRTNVIGFLLRLAARIPFLFIAGRMYGAAAVGRFALAVLVVEFFALLATLGLKRGLAQQLSHAERPHAQVVWDGLAVAFVASAAATGVLLVFPQLMYPNSRIVGFDRLLALIVFAIAWSDVALAALAYRLNVKAAVTARAVVEPWTLSVAALALAFLSRRDGLTIAYVLSMLAALGASMVPLLREYGLPKGWRPRFAPLFKLASANAPIAGADLIEWGTRNIDRFILGLFFSPAFVGVYYMAQQVATLPQKLKTSFDPVLAPVITHNLERGDKAAVAAQIRQVSFWIIAAQAGVALTGVVPGGAVMGTIGPEFVAGAPALAFLLTAEVGAATAAVCESALVYVARGRNLVLSVATIGIQLGLSLLMIAASRAAGLPPAWQAAATAAALLLALAIASVLKARLLGRLLGAPVSGWRPVLFVAVLVAVAVGEAATWGPEWAELILGVPLMLGTYAAVIWRWGFRAEDRLLFAKRTGPIDEMPAVVERL